MWFSSWTWVMFWTIIKNAPTFCIYMQVKHVHRQHTKLRSGELRSWVIPQDDLQTVVKGKKKLVICLQIADMSLIINRIHTRYTEATGGFLDVQRSRSRNRGFCVFSLVVHDLLNNCFDLRNFEDKVRTFDPFDISVLLEWKVIHFSWIN